MIRPAGLLAWLTVVALAAVVSARAPRPQDMVDRVQGVKIASRLQCDGSTNPQEELEMTTTFSAGGSPRSFHLDVFESRYCKYVDLYFFCVMHGHNKWKHEWEQDNGANAGPSKFWLKACSAWGQAHPQEYVLSGWYQEGAGGRKAAWKQGVIKQVSTAPEVYEFSDASGGTARLAVGRK